MVTPLDDLFGKPLFTLDVDGKLVTICLNRPVGDDAPLSLEELQTKVSAELAHCRATGGGPIAFLEGMDKALRELADTGKNLP